jgi:formate-dependent nitrite reductase membrane component NrfD
MTPIPRDDGYYGLPMLKRPLWGWEIALYFLSEGISSGCFVLGTMAELFGDGRHEALTRHARYLALATLIPCPPLLIADLGRPDRFHHMLRIVKLKSPMSVGVWAMGGFSVPLALLTVKHVARIGRMPGRMLAIAGLPFAFTMLAYPGVLLSTTSNPLWARTRYLGALLATSSMASATSALAVAAALDPESSDSTREALHRMEGVAKAAESVAMAAYVATTGEAARPLMKGRYSTMFRIGAFAVGVALPAFITFSRKKPGRAATVISGALSIAGAAALKWAIVHAGRDAVEDAALNREATRADKAHPGWMPEVEGRTGVLAGSVNGGLVSKSR